jgi:LysR family nitrogen assimilation transcriptional regulator
MDLKQLRYFVAIAEAGSLSRASERLGIAQPALSLKLAALESELATKLFDRGNRGVVLTANGALFLKHAATILQNINEAIAGVKTQDMTIVGKVRIGLPGTPSEIISTALVRQALIKYPNIFITLVEDGVKRLRRMLLDGRIDLAILVNEADQASFDINPLVVEQYCCVGPLDLADETTTIDWPALSRLPLLLPEQGSMLRNTIETAALANGVKLTPVAELASPQLMKNAVRAGLGFTILPWSTMGVEFDARSIWMRRIVRPELHSTLVLASSKIRPTSRAQQAIKLLILELADELVLDGRWKAELADDPARRPARKTAS